LSQLVGIHLQSGMEAEHADCLLALYPTEGGRGERKIPNLTSKQWQSRVPNAAFTGEPNALSREHHEWPAIDEVSRAAQCTGSGQRVRQRPSEQSSAVPTSLLEDRGHPAEQIVRQRRSAVAMDGKTSLDRTSFYQMLQRTLPGQFPLQALPQAPRVALVIFAHRVDNLEPGLYLLVRDPAQEDKLRDSLKPEFEWAKPDGCPDGLRLYRLLVGDARQAAKLISCNQDIAGDGVFSLGMLAEFDSTLAHEGPNFYPRLFWETGLIGQILYLEAEAAGIRGTGIGCFFDDLVHELLGIADRSWQSLYHFTVGGPILDSRIKTIAPYHHILSER
jgi:hypothetical protein